MSPAHTDPLLGAVAGGYRVLSLLSIGGMGSVYRAEHALIGRPAAIKVLLPEMSSNHEMVHRFFNEAKATTAIKHPGIVEVFDFGYLPSGQAYIVMELLDGMTVAQRMRAQGRMHESEAAMILRSACGALAAAHAVGVVHRDLKPDNIFLVADADSPIGVRCKLLDFGIAKLTAGVGAASSATKTGAVMGTPTYMSPEQCKGSGDVDARADLYALGCIFYELVAGRPPFVCEGAGELLGSHLFVEPEPPSHHAPGLSPEAEALILQLLAKQPARRVQSARELAARVSALAARHGWPVAVDLDGRMSMTSMPAGAPDENTQLAPLPTPAPAALGDVPFVAAPADETTQPIAVPLPPSEYTRPTPPAGRATAPMPAPIPPAPVATPAPPRIPTHVSVVAPMPSAPGVPTPMPMAPYVPTPPPMAAYVPTPPPMAAYLPTPTTLSGAAREAATMAPAAPGKLRPVRVAMALLAVGAIVGVILFFAVGRGGGEGPARPAATRAPDAAAAVTAPPPPAIDAAPALPAIDASAPAQPAAADAAIPPAPDAAAAAAPADAAEVPVDAPTLRQPHKPSPRPRPKPAEPDLLEQKI